MNTYPNPGNPEAPIQGASAPILKRYRIQHRPTGQWWNGSARSAQEACASAGWPIGECFVRERRQRG